MAYQNELCSFDSSETLSSVREPNIVSSNMTSMDLTLAEDIESKPITPPKTSGPDLSSSSSKTFPPSPSAWPLTRKYATLLTATLVCFTVGINSTAILSATDEISAEFHVNVESFDYSFFLVTTWNAGAAIVPLLLLPAMEDFGVRPIYLALYVIFVVFVVVQAVAANFATLLVSRFVAGSCGGVLQNAIDGMSADIWAGDARRMAFFLTLFVFALLGGVTVGPVIGGMIIKSLSWRWILYVQLIIYGAVFPCIYFFLDETRTESVRKPRVPIKKRIKTALNETVLRSSRMLCTEFVLGSFTLWSAFSFGTVFLLTQSIPLVYGTSYGWPAWKSGVVQVSILIGEAIGVALCMIQDLVVYPYFSRRASSSSSSSSTTESSKDPMQTAGQEFRTNFVRIPTNEDLESRSSQSSISSTLGTVLKRKTSNPQSESKQKNSNAEARLYTSIPASFLGLTAGLFIYAWTSSPSSSPPPSSSSTPYPWQLPTLGLILIGIGMQTIIQAVTIYITEHYGTLANSAVSAVAFGENIFAAFLPLATRDIYLNLGFGWAGSLLGFVALGVGFAPVFLVWRGVKRRSNSNSRHGNGN